MRNVTNEKERIPPHNMAAGQRQSRALVILVIVASYRRDKERSHSTIVSLSSPFVFVRKKS